MSIKRKIVKAVVYCAVALCLLFGRYASENVSAAEKGTPAVLEKTAQRYVLDNGMVVLIEEMPASTSVALYALVKTGSATEGEFLGTGISHFLEHMMFKGTEKRPVGTIAREIKSLGGFINASTSFDYTVYLIELPKEYFPQALDVLSDMLMNSKLEPEEVEKERDVVFGEMRLYKDRPERKLSELILKSAYVRHPYRHPIIGYEELLRKVTRDDLWQYYKKFYSPNNIIFGVAGGVEADKILPEIQNAFKTAQPGIYVERTLLPEPPQLAERYVEEEYATELTRVDMAYKSVPLLDKDLFAFDVLSAILGEARSSRLGREIYEKRKLVNGVGTSNFTPMDRGIFEVEMTLEYKNLTEAISAVKEQIELIKTNGATPAELETAKRRAISNYVQGHQTVGQVAYELVNDEAFTGDHEFSKKYVNALKGVTSDDIKRVAREYLKDENLTTAVLRPKSTEAESAKEKKSVPDVEVKKFVLDNGLTVLLRENHAFPLASVHLMLKGGVWQEPPGLGGVAELTGNMIGRETKSRSVHELEELLDSRGISGGSSSGQYIFGHAYQVLAEDLDLGLSLIEDALKNVKFSEKEFKQFKDNTKPAIISRHEDISFKALQTLKELLFPTNSLRKDAFGTVETVEKTQLKDVIEYYRKVHAPSNMVLFVFGDFETESTLALIKKKFSSLVGEGFTSEKHVDEAPKERIEQTIFMPKEQAIVAVGFQAPTIYDKDRHTVSLARSVLGSSLSGRIFVKVREELGQAYRLGADYVPGVDGGYAYFYVNTTDENVEKVKDILLTQIGELQTKEVTDQELADSKSAMKGNFKMSLDSNSALGYLCAFDELFGRGYDNYKNYEQAVDAITKEDIQRVAKQYFDLNKAVVVIVRPEKAKDAINPK